MIIIIFRKVIEAEEFLSLTSEEVIELISRGDIHVSSEEKVCILKLIIVVFNSCWEINLLWLLEENIFESCFINKNVRWVG